MDRPNPFVALLASYCPSPENEAAYDESIEVASGRAGVASLQLEHPMWARLVELLKCGEPPSIVLTGTAGDGKTHLCRRLFAESKGREWGKPIARARLPSGKTLVVVKDFTELGERDKANIVGRLAASAYGSGGSEVFLVAANEGILTRRTDWHGFDEDYRALVEAEAKKQWVRELHERLKDSLQGAGRESGRDHLRVFDLSRIPAVDNLDRVLKAILEHEGWHGCADCPGTHSDSPRRCPIYENRVRMRQPLVQGRLRALVELAEYNGDHLTMRHLLMLVANAIVGHRDVKGAVKAITRCDQMYDLADCSQVNGAYFQNLFGGNLPRALKVNPFALMSGFGVGNETNNRLDRLLIYGDLDPTLSESHTRLMASDTYYGETPAFLAARESYREDPVGRGQDGFLDHLVAQRRRLYFEMPVDDTGESGHEDLLVFKSAPEYRDEILAVVRKGLRVSEKHLNALVIGLNRVFVGALLSVTDKVLLATSGTTSQSRRSDLLIHPLSHNPIERVGVSVQTDNLEGTNGIPWLIVRHHGGELARMRLTVSRYEFLTRVADGVLPGSFSMELYEDMLAFKAQLIRGFFHETGPAELHNLPIRVVQLKEDGNAEFETVEVWGDSVHG